MNPSDVTAAISTRLRSLVGPDAMRPDMPNYAMALSNNFVAGALDEDTQSDFSAGDGGELEGDPPKMCAAHSSSALALNAFRPFRVHPERLSLVGLSGFTQTYFEKKLPTGLLGNPPNLDFVASGPAGVVAVESKFTETLSAKRAKFAASYEGAIARLAGPAWSDLYRSLLGDPSRFKHLDAAQLVKHYLGMRNSLRDAEGRLVLMYVFWEPTNWSDGPAFVQHRRELDEFAECVRDGDVAFLSMSYSSLWDQWEVESDWDRIGEHVTSLRERYELPVPL
jgi:restriction endonuclease-like protein